MPPANSEWDPRVIERFAEQLLAKADSVRVGFAVGGGVFGVLVGAVPLTPLQSVWKISGAFAFASILIGALIGVLLGYVVGEGRAFRYRVQAQMALFQVEIEKRVSAAVTPRRVARPAQAAPVAAAPSDPPPTEAAPTPPPAPAAPPMPAAPVAAPVLAASPAAPVAPLLRGPNEGDRLPPVSQAPAAPPITPAASA